MLDPTNNTNSMNIRESILCHPSLSIIIPALNEERRLAHALDQIIAFADVTKLTMEVIVVDNASTDLTAKIATDYSARYPFIKYLCEPNRGKGAAVRTGMLAGQGDYLLMSDADLAVPITEVTKFLPPQIKDFDVAVGSRELKGAKRYGEPLHRHVMGRVFNLIVRLLILNGLRDTQCGFKCFRRVVAHNLFGSNQIDGWGFDVEILVLSRLRGYRIVEKPVEWFFGDESKVNPLKDACHMLKELLTIRRNRRKGVYHKGGISQKR